MLKDLTGLVIGAAIGGAAAFGVLSSADAPLGRSQSAAADTEAVSVAPTAAASERGASTAAPNQGASEAASEGASAAQRSAALDALAERAEDDPRAVLTEALALEPGLRRAGVRRAGAVWARSDPLGALAYAYTLPPDLRDLFRASVAAEWAARDAQGFLSHAADATDIDALSAGLDVLIVSEPERVFEISSRLSPVTTPFFTTIGAQALRHLVDRNPAAMLAFLESQPVSVRRDLFFMEAAATYAFFDPDSAFEWAAGTNSTMALWGALTSVGAFDFGRGREFVAEHADPRAPNALNGALVAGSLNEMRDAVTNADLLRTAEDPGARAMLTAFVNQWILRDTRTAVDWLVEHSDEVGASTVATAATTLAVNDVGMAIRYKEALPPEWQDDWILQTAAPYAALDPQAAYEWIDPLRGQAGYDDALTRVIANASSTDPLAAARMADGASAAVRAATAETLVRNWAEQDPAAAGAWAMRLAEPSLATTTVPIVVQHWLASDPDAAGGWALGLPLGAARDSALTQVIVTSTAHDLALRPFTDAYSSPAARERSLGAVIDSLGAEGGATAAAAQFIDALPDPDLRRWAEERLAAARERAPR